MPKNKTKKIKVGVLFGGKSAEHEVSIISAKNVIKGLDKSKYQAIPIKIDKKGKFSLLKLKKAQVVFPVLHGPFGEDGTIQGLLKVLNIPFVGPGVLGSAICMDKDIMKRLLRDAKIPTANFITVRAGDLISFLEIKKKLGLPLFIKPANLGSSVGISKVKNEKEFVRAIREAFKYDTKIIIEETIVGREIECAVLGNEKPISSLAGEIIPQHEFYSYEAKYLDSNGAILKFPADLSPKITSAVQKLAIKSYRQLECSGMARVDFFLTPKGKLLVIEINTIPGFTAISMYPKLWQVSGWSIHKLLDKLIMLAFDRFNQEQKLKNSFK